MAAVGLPWSSTEPFYPFEFQEIARNDHSRERYIMPCNLAPPKKASKNATVESWFEMCSAVESHGQGAGRWHWLLGRTEAIQHHPGPEPRDAGWRQGALSLNICVGHWIDTSWDPPPPPLCHGAFSCLFLSFRTWPSQCLGPLRSFFPLQMWSSLFIFYFWFFYDGLKAPKVAFSSPEFVNDTDAHRVKRDPVFSFFGWKVLFCPEL